MAVNKNALTIATSFIKEFEGCKLKAYRDLGGIWTIGYGSTGKGIEKGVVWTQEQADDRLLKDVGLFGISVLALLHVELNDNQLAALISFAYNVGLHSLAKSTLLRKINNFQEGAENEFLKWNKVNGKEVSGLTRRRTAERDLFLA